MTERMVRASLLWPTRPRAGRDFGTPIHERHFSADTGIADIRVNTIVTADWGFRRLRCGIDGRPPVPIRREQLGRGRFRASAYGRDFQRAFKFHLYLRVEEVIGDPGARGFVLRALSRGP